MRGGGEGSADAAHGDPTDGGIEKSGEAAEPPRLVGTRSVYAGWNTLDVVTIEATAQDGRRKRYDREVVNHGDASAVLLIDSARAVAILVRQWRAPQVAEGRDPYLLEACAGIIDDGESAEQAARREVLEETGYTLGALRRIGCVSPSGGTLTERIHLFIAEVGERLHAGGGDPAEGEVVEVVEVPLATLFLMASQDGIEDAKTLILAQRLMIEEAAARGPRPA